MDDNALRLLNRRISKLEREIADRDRALLELYKQRRGRVLWRGNELAAAWCCVCGAHRVDPLRGEDTCTECNTTAQEAP